MLLQYAPISKCFHRKRTLTTAQARLHTYILVYIANFANYLLLAHFIFVFATQTAMKNYSHAVHSRQPANPPNGAAVKRRIQQQYCWPPGSAAVCFGSVRAAVAQIIFSSLLCLWAFFMTRYYVTPCDYGDFSFALPPHHLTTSPNTAVHLPFLTQNSLTFHCAAQIGERLSQVCLQIHA